VSTEYRSHDHLAIAISQGGQEAAIQDRFYRVWLAWENEDGDCYAIRARDEDDEPGPQGWRWAPIGPVRIDQIPLPARSLPAFDAGGDPR